VLSRAAPESRGFLRRTASALLALVAALPAAAAELQSWALPETPSLALPSLAGDTVDVSAACGRVVLVHFFATWCEPCRDEIAALERLAVRADAPNILAVSVGEVPARVKKFFGERPPSFPVLLDGDRRATKDFSVLGLPTTFVLDRALRPARRVEGDLDWTMPATLEALERIAAAAAPDCRRREPQGGYQ
jgi:thiol-disulfide isomerase/thioredoxin